MPALAELEAAWVAGARATPASGASSTALLRDYVGRPSPLYLARAAERGRRPPDLPQARGPQPHRRAQDQQRARPGAARQADGQAADHRRDRRRPARRRDRDRVRAARPRVRRLHGHRGHAPPEARTSSGWGCSGRASSRVDAGARTLKEAVSAAIRDWVANVDDDPLHHRLVRRAGAVPGARPRPPAGDRRRGPRADARARPGGCRERVIACVGGGSNAIGMFAAFVDDAEVELIGVEAAGEGIETGRHGAPLTAGGLPGRPARRVLGGHAGRGRPDPRGPLDLGRPRLPRAPAPSTPGCATRAAPATSRSPTPRRSTAFAAAAAARGDHPGARERARARLGAGRPRQRARPGLPLGPRRQGPRPRRSASGAWLERAAGSADADARPVRADRRGVRAAPRGRPPRRR